MARDLRERHFRHTGPRVRRGDRSPDLGIDHLTGWPDRPSSGMGSFSYPDFTGGMQAAVAVLIGILQRDTTGQGVGIDLSQLEVAVAAIGPVIMDCAANGTSGAARGNQAEGAALPGIYPARGDQQWVALACRDEDEWEALRGVAGEAVASWTARFTSRGPRLPPAGRRMPGGARRRSRGPAGLEDVLGMSRWQREKLVDDGVVFDTPDPELAFRAPYLPSVRHFWRAFGVYGTKLLADLGADVVQIEPPKGDPMRTHPPFLHGVPGPSRSLYFAYMNTSKRSVTLGLGCAQGRDLLAQLAATAEVVAFAGERTRCTELGLEGLGRSCPRLVVSAITPFGLTGPFQHWKGNDLVAWATGGLAGVRTQRQHGTGQIVDVSLQQAVLATSGESGVSAFLDDLQIRTRSGSWRPVAGPMGHFLTSDGFAAVLAVMPAHWEALARWIYEKTGDEAAMDPGLKGPAFVRSGDRRAVANRLTEQLSLLYTKQELFEEGQRRGISVTPVNDAASVLADPQLAHRGYRTEIEVDGEAVRAPGRPAEMTGVAWSAGRPPAPASTTPPCTASSGCRQGTSGVSLLPA